MTTKLSRRARRSSTILNTLLLSSALAVPALAGQALSADLSGVTAAAASGSEEVVVTAQKRQENVQKVPIAVTAIGTKELASKQIASFRDLQFTVPSVTYSKGNFNGNNFQVRGIGINAVGISADTGVAIHTNDVYQLSSVGLATAEYFDLERIEVLRGPQSTLYGRNATGGAVNIITAKPKADALAGSIDATYGEHNTGKVHAMVNIPVIDNELAVRIAGVYAHHDGYDKNIVTGNDDDSENLWSLRGSVRWTPSDRTTIDLMAEEDFEKDSHMRSPKQLCHRDPSGVLGCLPDALGFEATNGNAGLGNIIGSTATLGALGLIDLGLNGPAIPGSNANSLVPNDLYTIASDIDPTNRSNNQFYMGSIKQDLTDWLTMTGVVGYQKGNYVSTESYNNLVNDDLSQAIPIAVGTFEAAFGPLATPYVQQFFSHPGEIPYSSPSNSGLQGGNIAGYTSKVQGSDQSDGQGYQTSYELRFNTHFDGPLNFLLAGFYMDSKQSTRYFVNANTLDYASIILGRLESIPGVQSGAIPPSQILLLGPANYLSDTSLYTLKSKAVFGEAYYDIIPDELKLTIGLRWLNDEKRTVSGNSLFNALIPYPTVDIQDYIPEYADQHVAFNQVTGRAVLNWTPKVDWSDSTLFYASYSRGFKSGGINPPLPEGTTVPQYFAPEKIDAFEIGTKNRFFDNTFQANLTAWYYDYSSYQVSQIVDRTSVNENIGAKLWGLEGEFVYKPNEHWQFSFNLSNTHSDIGDSASVDQRNPGAGLQNAVVVKDLSSAATCVVLMAQGVTQTPGDAGVPGFYNPPGGSGQLAQYGVPHVNYGSCSAALPAGYSYTANSSGVEVSLKGNELPQTPDLTASFGVQYTYGFESGYELVLRSDYYKQSSMFARIYNDPVDRIDSWGVLNLSVQLNAPHDSYYVKVFCTNCTDEESLTGEYLTDASSGLFTNAFVQDPRIIGVTVGANF